MRKIFSSKLIFLLFFSFVAVYLYFTLNNNASDISNKNVDVQSFELKVCALFLGIAGTGQVTALLWVLTGISRYTKDHLNAEVFLSVAQAEDKHSLQKTKKNTVERIVISFVVCDSRFDESLKVVKSALLFTKTPLHFVIFTDDILTPKFNQTLNKWRTLTNYQLSFELQKINFPKAYEEDWMNLFSKCAAQRLFIPKLISHIDAMIYVDTDTVFLGPADELWNFFSDFNSTHISAMTLEDDNPNVSWYPRFAKHPYYGDYGLNSGVMLMNLTRMRSFGWVDYVTPIMLKWKLYIPWGDQDIINIIFHYHTNAVLILSCRYNYRTDQCTYGDACADATARGVHLLHGSRKAFHNHKQPAFEAIYRAIDEYELGTGTNLSLVVNNMEKYLNQAPSSNCGNLKEAFLKVPYKTINNTRAKPDR